MYRSEALLRAWADRDVENARRARQSIIGTQNGRKATQARLDGLLDPAFIDRKARAEDQLRQLMRKDQRLKSADRAYDQIASLLEDSATESTAARMWEGGEAFGTRLFQIARTLVRAAAENEKPDGARLPEYQESGRPSLEHMLFSKQPFYRDLETLRLGDSLTIMCAKLGVAHPLVRQILDGASPRARAAEWIHATKLDSVEERRRLYEGGTTAINQSEDPLIRLALAVDPEARTWRTKGDATSEAISRAHGRIADARFAIEGDSVYPDATGTLRLSYGVVLGAEGPEGFPAFTTLQTMLERHQHQGSVAPFDLTPQWLERAAAIPPQTRLNFVSTHDITGGNSGSPVVNRAGELVGLIFDSNAPGLVSDFGFNNTLGRAISVHPAAMLALLRHIHQADRLLKELGR
jgi:hypothetical protein